MVTLSIICCISSLLLKGLRNTKGLLIIKQSNLLGLISHTSFQNPFQCLRLISCVLIIKTFLIRHQYFLPDKLSICNSLLSKSTGNTEVVTIIFLFALGILLVVMAMESCLEKKFLWSGVSRDIAAGAT